MIWTYHIAEVAMTVPPWSAAAIRTMDGPALTELAHTLGLSPQGSVAWWEPHARLDHACAVLHRLEAQGWTTSCVWDAGQQHGVYEVWREGRKARGDWGEPYRSHKGITRDTDATETLACLRCCLLALAQQRAQGVIMTHLRLWLLRRMMTPRLRFRVFWLVMLLTWSLLVSTHVGINANRTDLNKLRSTVDVLRAQRDRALAVMEAQRGLITRIEEQRDTALDQRDTARQAVQGLEVLLREARQQCTRERAL